MGISSPWCDVCARVAAAREREGEIDGEGRGLMLTGQRLGHDAKGRPGCWAARLLGFFSPSLLFSLTENCKKGKERREG